MPLEATMIVLDNSEYMRNGDYQPTRFGALADAVTTVFQTKIDSNPENTVGVMTMANKGCVRSLSPPTRKIRPRAPIVDPPIHSPTQPTSSSSSSSKKTRLIK